MALNDAALTVGATAIEAVLNYGQLYSAATNSAGTTNAVGSRVAISGSVDSDGDITFTSTAFTGLSASQAVYSIGYWSASSSGTFYGERVLTGDATANAAGEYTVTSITETGTAT